MQFEMMMYSSVLLWAGVFMIAATAIGIQAFNNCAEWKAAKGANFKFLVATLVSAIGAVFIAFFGLYRGFTSDA